MLSFLAIDIVSPIEREIRALSHGLSAVKDEQEYIVVRERTHRNTAESTNDRVKWWSILQAVVLFSVVAWQVYYLKARHKPTIETMLVLNALAVILRGQAGLLITGRNIWSSCIIYSFTSDLLSESFTDCFNSCKLSCMPSKVRKPGQ